MPGLRYIAAGNVQAGAAARLFAFLQQSCLLVLLLWPGTLSAGTFGVYGHEADIRSKSVQPDVFTATFDALNPDTTYTLKVYNSGIKGSDITGTQSSSTELTLNGEIIELPDDFKRKNDFHLERGVKFQASNKITLMLGDKSRSVVALEFEGLHNDPAVTHIKGVAITEVVWDLVYRPGSIDNAEGQVTDILYGSYAGVSGEARIAALHGRAESLCSDIE